jgi:hypothetical protein
MPTNEELNEIAQEKAARLTMERRIFQILPTRDVNASRVIWDQKDDYRGLQQLRGMNGQPPRVNLVGYKRYESRPGVYGEFTSLDEEMLTDRAAIASYGVPMSIEDMIMDAQDMLLQRRIDRMEKNGWDLLVNGNFSVYLPTGAVGHTDTYALQTFTADVDWSDHVNSKPLADLREMKMLARGKGVSFGAGATLEFNQVTINHMLSNRNQDDLAGKRMDGLATALSVADVNKILTGEDLPSIRANEDGWIDDNGDFQLFVPDGAGVLVGKRPVGQRIGEIQLTRNAQNPDVKPGPYQYVKDMRREKGEGVAEIQVHDGVNGGIALFYPGSLVRVTVF